MTKCKCGHEKEGHHEGKWNCLYSLCECRAFLDERAPDPKPQRPFHAAWCECYRCKESA